MWCSFKFPVKNDLKVSQSLCEVLTIETAKNIWSPGFGKCLEDVEMNSFHSDGFSRAG